MKFGKKYREYLDGEGTRFGDKYSYVDYNRLKKMLNKCQLRNVCEHVAEAEPTENKDIISRERARCISEPCNFSKALCPSQTCSVCDKIFFEELRKQISAAIGCFNSRARDLGNDLFTYAAMNTIAVRKILNKYDKVHSSVNGCNFKTKLQANHKEILKSPWLIALCAFQINLRDSDNGEIFPECSCDFTVSDPLITCEVADVKIEFSLTCPICLDTIFDVVSLACGHIFYNSCACTVASIPTTEGVKTANRCAKCPICRQMGVYSDAIHLTEVSLIVKNRCGDYWKQGRIKVVERPRQYLKNTPSRRPLQSTRFFF